MTERQRKMKLYNPLYKRINTNWTICFYCGDHSYVFDHCPPISIIDGMDINKYTKAGGKLLLIPSCSLCNKALGAFPSTVLLERMERVEEYYTKKANYYDKLWHEDEIEELGPNIRSLVETNHNKMKDFQAKADKVANRISDFLLEDAKDDGSY